MAFEHKENRGSIFINDKKEKDTHPDRKGSANIDGKLYWVSGWDEITRDGQRSYLSLSFQLQDNQGSHDADQGSDAGQEPAGGFDDIPF